MELDNPEKVISVVKAYLRFTNKTTDELCRALGHTPRQSNGEPTPEYRRIDAILAGVDGIYSRTYTGVPKSTLYSAKPLPVLKVAKTPPPRKRDTLPPLKEQRRSTREIVRKLEDAIANISQLKRLSRRSVIDSAGIPNSTIANPQYTEIRRRIDEAIVAEQKRRKLAG